MTLAQDGLGPSSACVRIPPPRTQSSKLTRLMYRIVALGISRAPQAAGPVIAVLIAMEALNQVISKHSELMQSVQLDHVRLAESYTRQACGVPPLSHELQGLPGNRDVVHDAFGLSVGLLLLNRYLEMMRDTELKREVEQIRIKLQVPLFNSVDGSIIWGIWLTGLWLGSLSQLVYIATTWQNYHLSSSHYSSATHIRSEWSLDGSLKIVIDLDKVFPSAPLFSSAAGPAGCPLRLTCL